MGGELLLFYLVPAGALLGVVAAWLVAMRSVRVGWPKYLRVCAAFAAGVLVPVLLLLAIGSIAKYMQSKPKLASHSGLQQTYSEAAARLLRPNPSLERTRTGMALGPRGAHCHHSPRGPSAMPALSAQLKR